MRTLWRWAAGFSLVLVIAACAAPYFPGPQRSEGFINFETEPLRHRTIALFNTTVEWLETCGSRGGRSWAALTTVLDCSLAVR